MQAEQIAKALSNAKKVNGQWMASCPVSSHGQGNGDRNPSLCITDNDDGKPLFKCFSGCSQESVFNAIKDYGLLKDLPQNPLAGKITALLNLASRLPSQIWYEPDPKAHDQRFWPQILAALQSNSYPLGRHLWLLPMPSAAEACRKRTTIPSPLPRTH